MSETAGVSDPHNAGHPGQAILKTLRRASNRGSDPLGYGGDH